jgi:hypothetical protein
MHKKRIIDNRLGPQHRLWLTITFALLFLSGALWLIFHYFFAVKTEFGEGPHPLQQWWLKLHGLAAMAALIIFGSLLLGHIRRAWHHHQNRISGGGMVALVILLTLSGYALYYFGGEKSRPIISASHWIIGIAALSLLVLHIVSGRRSRQREINKH